MQPRRDRKHAIKRRSSGPDCRQNPQSGRREKEFRLEHAIIAIKVCFTSYKVLYLVERKREKRYIEFINVHYHGVCMDANRCVTNEKKTLISTLDQ